MIGGNEKSDGGKRGRNKNVADRERKELKNKTIMVLMKSFSLAV